MTDADSEHIIAVIRNWLEAFVIELNLCPFAKRELVKERIRFIVTEHVEDEAILADVKQEIQLLQQDPSIETTLLILANGFGDFLEYNDFLGLVEEYLEAEHLTGDFQVASFHPQYQFAGTEMEDVENYTNRSPYPILHLLREASVTRAVDSYPNIDSIPDNNIALLNKLGRERILNILSGCLDH